MPNGITSKIDVWVILPQTEALVSMVICIIILEKKLKFSPAAKFAG